LQHDAVVERESERQDQRALDLVGRRRSEFDREYALPALVVDLLLRERAVLGAVLLDARRAPVVI
jgi:hypothetical protein